MICCAVRVCRDRALLAGFVSSFAPPMSAIEVLKDGAPCLGIVFLICETANGPGNHSVNHRLLVYGLFCAATSGSGLQTRGCRIERWDSTEVDVPTSSAKTCRRSHQLCFRKCRRYFWAQLISGRDAGRQCRDCSSSFLRAV